MTDLAWMKPGRTAVITGAAGGIGLAAARRFAAAGMNVMMADRDRQALESAADDARRTAVAGAAVETALLDVADFDQVEALKARAFERFGEVGLMMNNAGIGGGGHAFEARAAWSRVLGVNLFGVINGVQAFAQAMIDQKLPAAIVNTGSKQGITTPPGDTAYNVSKAGVKALTEGLEHTLRQIPEGLVRAHLLVPGFTFTGMTRRGAGEKPPGAWTPEQVIDFALERMAAQDFYILCPDNEVTREIDRARIAWAAMDVTENRPPLSRWHEDWKGAFAAFLAERGLHP